MSAEHARIRHAAKNTASILVEDAGSSNGTFLNGLRLEGPEGLEPGAVLSIGDTLLALDVEPDPDTLPADDRVEDDRRRVPEIAGVSATASRLRRSVATVATARGSVLLLGPSGSGKEIAARAIHRASGRSGALVAVNCAAIPGELADAELFGHRKGAFTGATQDREGYFARAQGGTLFLDEVGDLPAPLQAKLLRAIEDGKIQPVGGGDELSLDVRIVAATHQDLEQPGFRKDLLARLADWVLHIPPLAERKSDVLELLQHFLASEGSGPREITAELGEALLVHDWPLNVRELRRLARRLATFGAGDGPIDLFALPESLQRPIRERGSAGARTPDAETLRAAMEGADGNVSKVADGLGCDRAQVYRWLRRYGIDPSSYRGEGRGSPTGGGVD